MKRKTNFISRLIDFWIPEKSLSNGGDYLRKARLLIISCWGVLLATLGYLPLYLYLGHYWGSGVCLFGFVAAVALLLIFRKTGNLIFGGNYFAFAAFVFFLAFSVGSYGLRTTIPAWVLMVPVSAGLLANRKSAIIWSILSVLLLAFLYFANDFLDEFPALFPEEQIPIVSLAACLGLVGYITLIILNNESWREKSMDRLQKAREEIEKQNIEIREHQLLLEKKNREILTMNMNLERDASRKVRKLEESNQDLDTFFYESSHALRRPLTRIMGLLNLLNQDIGEDQYALLKEHITVTSRRMDMLLRSLVGVSEMTTYTPEISDVNLAIEVEKIWEKVREDEKVGDLFSFENQIDESLQVRCDRHLFSMVMENLFDNSVKYHRSSATGGPKVRVSAGMGKAWLEIRIWDNGLGIHPKVISNLFNLFVRGTEKSTGSGLGLYMVRKMVEKMEGEIRVDSQFGEYSEFIFSLPISHNKDGKGIWRAG